MATECRQGSFDCGTVEAAVVARSTGPLMGVLAGKARRRDWASVAKWMLSLLDHAPRNGRPCAAALSGSGNYLSASRCMILRPSLTIVLAGSHRDA
jgi:hypothetical protein